jgi:hypothetical protein
MGLFTTENLSPTRFIKAFTRIRIASGWYVRAVFGHEGTGGGTFCESAIYLHDPDNAWDSNNIEWQWISDEPRGGIFQCAVPGGWLIVATAKGETLLSDHEKLATRFGSLTFVPDPEHTCRFKAIRDLNGNPIRD